MDAIMMRQAQIDALATYIGAGLTDAMLFVFSNNLALTRTTALADLDIVAQAGMVAAAVTWDDPWIDTAGDVVLSAPSHAFVCGGTLSAPFTVYGWGVQNAAATVLLFATMLDNAVPINVVGEGVSITPLITPFANP